MRIIVFVVICFAAARLNAAAPETIYRLVSAAGGNDPPVFNSLIVKGDDEPGRGSVRWSSLPFKLWFPKPKQPLDEGTSFTENVTFTDAGFPSVNSQVKVSVQKPVVFSRGEAALCVFFVRGSAKAIDVNENYSASDDGIESVSIIGDGMFLVDKKSSKVIAGRAKFSRKFTYALWRADIGKRENSEEIDVAWSVVP